MKKMNPGEWETDCTLCVNNVCLYYKKINPPLNVCEVCKYYSQPEEAKRNCEPFISKVDDGICVYIDPETKATFYRSRPEACDNCQWPEGGRVELFDPTGVIMPEDLWIN